MYPKWRWVVCPVVLDGKTRKPLVGLLENPDGRIPSQGFTRAQAISNGLPGEENDWCLCRVKMESAKGEAVIANHPDIVSYPEFDHTREERYSSLAQTPRDKGLSRQAISSIKARLNLVGRPRRMLATRNLTEDSPARDFLKSIGDRLMKFDPEDVWAD